MLWRRPRASGRSEGGLAERPCWRLGLGSLPPHCSSRELFPPAQQQQLWGLSLDSWSSRTQFPTAPPAGHYALVLLPLPPVTTTPRLSLEDDTLSILSHKALGGGGGRRTLSASPPPKARGRGGSRACANGGCRGPGGTA